MPDSRVEIGSTFETKTAPNMQKDGKKVTRHEFFFRLQKGRAHCRTSNDASTLHRVGESGSHQLERREELKIETFRS